MGITIAYLLLLHFISDFCLQSRKMGTTKSSNWVALGGHGLIIFIVFFAGTGAEVTSPQTLFCLCYTLLHMIQDKIIWTGYKLYWNRKFKKQLKENPILNMKDIKSNFKYWEDHLFYTTIGFDQLLHCLSIIGLWSLFNG